MEIAVCINLVPDTASPVTVRDGVLDETRLNMVLNPYDEYAVEEAVRLRENGAGSTVTAFSAGGGERRDILRKALAMGADRACVVEGDVSGDSFAVAHVLAGALRRHYGGVPDLVLCGRESADCNRGQVPLMLAGLLGIAAVSAVTALATDGGGDGRLTVEREIEGGREVYALVLPALVSAEKGLNIPRKTNMRAVMHARKQPIDTVETVTPSPESRVVYEEMATVERERSCTVVESPEELVRMLLRSGRFSG